MVSQKIAFSQKTNVIGNFEFLMVLALGVDLFTPFFIWRGILPSAIRWGSHAAIAAMILVSIFRMLTFNHIPRSFGFMIAVSLIWSAVAIGNGQGIPVTVWGVWLLFQFPFVGLFAYLQSGWPRNFPELLRKFALLILALEVFVQLVQYARGMPPGDHLGGLFAENGTGNALLFEMLVCCLFFGHWIASGRWLGLLVALSMSMLSSVLGEMKLFFVAITVVGLISVVLYAFKYRAPEKMLIHLCLIFVTLISFVSLYNMIVPGANEFPIQRFLTDPTKLSEYLNRVETIDLDGNLYTDIGRGYAVELGWNSLQRGPVTFLFGYGLGTRSESRALGTAGIALTTDDLGLSAGTSLLVMMQELGVLGLTLLTGLFIWILQALVHDIRTYPESPVIGLRYALLLFSILWPLWLWYAAAWTMRVPMLLYWLLLGYAFSESRAALVELGSNVPGLSGQEG